LRLSWYWILWTKSQNPVVSMSQTIAFIGSYYLTNTDVILVSSI